MLERDSAIMAETIEYKFEVLELDPPHGFLMAQEKQTAVARIEPLDTEQSYLIVSNGEAFGFAEFEQPAQVKTKEFDTKDWLNQHRVTPRERRQWWPDIENFYVYRLKKWNPFDGIKLYEDGQIRDEPKLTAKQWKLVSTAKELPKQITLIDDAVGITNQKTFIFDKDIDATLVEDTLRAAYDLDYVVNEKVVDEYIPLYSLALVRNPRMRVSKKSPNQISIKGLSQETIKKLTIKAEKINAKEAKKQEDEAMPFRIRKRDDEYCVVKVNPDDSDGDVSGCHETEAEAEAQLAALRINVEAEEGERDAKILGAMVDNEIAVDLKGKPYKSEAKELVEVPGLDEIITTGTREKKQGFMESLRAFSKTIGDFLKSAETEEKGTETDILSNDFGVTQKEVNGEMWHFTWSTNAFEDREKEIFSTQSLEQYVKGAKEKEDKGFFNLWHIEGTDFAKKEWQGVVGRFLVEAGPYFDDSKGQSARDFFKQYGKGHPEIAPEGWGCSPEFRYLPEERAKGIYENIWITRTSTLPRMAAANIWTETRQLARSKMALSEDQIKAAIEVFKDEDFVNNLIQEGENKTAELEAAGVAHKENSEPEPQEIQLNMEELAAEVGKQFTANLTPIAEAMATMAKELKELKEWKDKQDEERGIKDRTEKPRFIFNMQRASEQEETIVTDDDGLKDKKPTEATENSNDPWLQMFNK